MENIIVIGGGGHAKVVISILKKNKEFSLLGYTDGVDNGSILGIGYIGSDDILPQLVKQKKCRHAALGIGQVNLTNKRQEIINKILTLGYEFPSIISIGSIVNEGVEIGAGTVVFDGVVINSGTRIGKYSIINTSVTIDHDCEIGDFVHIAPGAVLCGGVRVKSNSMLGSGSTITQYKQIGECCTIGAGAVVTRNCLEPGTYMGVPANKIL